jgi:hypothetical protein
MISAKQEATIRYEVEQLESRLQGLIVGGLLKQFAQQEGNQNPSALLENSIQTTIDTFVSDVFEAIDSVSLALTFFLKTRDDTLLADFDISFENGEAELIPGEMSLDMTQIPKSLNAGSDSYAKKIIETAKEYPNAKKIIIKIKKTESTQA